MCRERSEQRRHVLQRLASPKRPAEEQQQVSQQSQQLLLSSRRLLVVPFPAVLTVALSLLLGEEQSPLSPCTGGRNALRVLMAPILLLKKMLWLTRLVSLPLLLLLQ